MIQVVDVQYNSSLLQGSIREDVKISHDKN